MEFKRSTRSDKKYMVYHDSRWIHFGDNRYEHYRDQTPLKLYSHLDHNDDTRRKSYLARAKGIRNKAGKLTWLDPTSPNYYSVKYLW